MQTKTRNRSGKLKKMSRVEHWILVRLKLLVKREYSIYGTGRYAYSTEAEPRTRTGLNPVGLKWIDTNKRYRRSPRYRSRLVCTVRRKGVEPIFSATCPLETLRVRLGVACQEDVFRAEDPFLISTADVSRDHFYADAVRDVYVPRTPRQCSQACVENCERRCTGLWMLPNGGDNIMLRFWRREDFPEAWLLTTFSTKACKPTFGCTVTISS